MYIFLLANVSETVWDGDEVKQNELHSNGWWKEENKEEFYKKKIKTKNGTMIQLWDGTKKNGQSHTNWTCHRL